MSAFLFSVNAPTEDSMLYMMDNEETEEDELITRMLGGMDLLSTDGKLFCFCIRILGASLISSTQCDSL